MPSNRFAVVGGDHQDRDIVGLGDAGRGDEAILAVGLDVEEIEQARHSVPFNQVKRGRS